MNRSRLFILSLPVVLAACSPVVDDRGTIAQLRNRHIEIREEKIDGGLAKAMEGYRRFLKETPDSPLAPEAIRRLADLKVENEYGFITDHKPEEQLRTPSPLMGEGRGGGEAVHVPSGHHPPPSPLPSREGEESLSRSRVQESDSDFVERAAAGEMSALEGSAPAAAPDDLERAGALEAVELYRKLLTEYPLYERNDQVLYQMSRAYEELGRIEEAMEVMDRVARDFPRSRYIDEVQFRRAEYFFTRRKYLDAEDAYRSIVELGVGSSFHQLALYKLGWTFYKQELYEDALHKFIALLDAKVSEGYDFEQTEDESERKRMDDTFRVISLSFSNLGGADSAVDYFSGNGGRSYEDSVYGNLGEYYVDKRRYSDAVATYEAFVSRNPFHKMSPRFHMRVIEINIAGGFPTLVIDAKKAFATNYGLKAEYWRHFDPESRPEVLRDLKTNLTDLANHYHALYQNPKEPEGKPAHFAEARHWYREFLVTVPDDEDSPAVNYQLADLLLENRSFGEAAAEYEKTAYGYPTHDKSSTAGYAAVYAWREHLGSAAPEDRDPVRREVVRSSLTFAGAFPEHEKAAVVLGAAADDLYAMGDHEQALAAGRELIEAFPGADKDVLRAGWLVVAHSSYELLLYAEAEAAYVKVLDLLPEEDKARGALVDNLAASIYKQAEEANALEDYRSAADHFLRVGLMAPTSKIRATAEYDGAAALIRLKAWKEAASVLSGFRGTFPGHELQPEVTKKIAFVYREDGRLSMAAGEYERIERESRDEEVRKEALLVAAQLYEDAGDGAGTLAVYRRYVDYFPRPVDVNLETRGKIAEMLKGREDRQDYLDELRRIVAIEAAAVDARTPRTRFLAANAALVLAEPGYDRFMEVRLVKPFEVNLRRKQSLMKTAVQEFGRLLDYEVGDVTAASTYYLAEIYAHFSKALTASERPEGLSPLEMEQYELAIEEQAYPFEEKAIAVHESNLELISLGIYNGWIEKSLERLAGFVPARYDKPEEQSGIISSLDTYTFAIERPEPPALPGLEEEKQVEETVQAEEPVDTGEPVPVKHPL
jgi:tetratricopeptide (TPR) repeat protein